MGCVAGRPGENVDVDMPPPVLLVHTESTYRSKSGSFREDYKILRVISPSEHRRVYEVEHKTTKEKFAVKEISHKAESAADQHTLLKEVKILSSLDHPNLIKLIEVYEAKHKSALVQELLTGGELFEYIVQSGFLDEVVAANVMRQLLSAVAYCHQRKVVLRNIKPENILLAFQPTSPQDIHVKIVDFGLSTLLSGDRNLHKIVGTELYTAPEVFSGNYDEACDAWSCGVLLYVMLAGTLPFDGSSPEEIQGKICRGEYSLDSPHWSIVTPEAKNLIQKLLMVEPGNRISPAEALDHPWLTSHQSVDILHTAKSQGLLLELRKFQGEKKLKQMLGGYLTDRYVHSDEQTEQRQYFESLDKDHSGHLSRQELIDAFAVSMPVDEAAQQVDTILHNMDADTSLTIDYREFLSASFLHCKLLSMKNLEQAFEDLDENHDGQLSTKELRRLLGQSVQGGDRAIDELIAQADVNHDGVLSRKEFMVLLWQK